jgi:hypothetical protein
MRRRVALVSSCCPPLPGRPVTGGGLRTAQLLETLRAGGHSVVLFVERDALPAEVPEGVQAFDADGLADALKGARASVIVLEQWALAAHLGSIDKPLVIDLHGSLLLENVYRRGELDLVLDAGAKLEALHRADLLLCPAPAQLHHFASWATLAGFDPRELPLALLPLAMPGAPSRRRAKKPALRIVYGGARWPWIDSCAALSATAAAVADLAGATLDVFTYEPPRHGLAMEEDLGTWADVDAALPGRPGVTHHGGVGQDAYAEFLRGTATVALDVWAPNAERLLAATTRTGEFLHAGLPVITVAGSAWAEELVATGAGWALPPGDDDALATLLADLAGDPTRIAAASRAATELMAGPHSLERAGAALCAFVASPHRPTRSPSTLVGSVVAIRQTHLDETLRSERAAHEDEHRRLVAAHRSEVAALRATHGEEIEELSHRHAGVAEQLRAAHRADVDRLSVEARAAASAQAEDHAAQTSALRAAHRAEVEALTAEHRAALEATVAEHRAQADALAASFREQMAAATAERKAEVHEVLTHARAEAREAEERHRAAVAEAVAGQRMALEDGRAAIERSAGELEAAVEEHRGQMEAATRAHRQEMEGEAARHRQELEQAVASWQGRLDTATERARSDRHQAREARTRLEVEHRAELARAEERANAGHREADQARARVGALEAELAGVRTELSAARATLAAKLRERLGRVDPLDALPGRARPALQLAKLWVEHALDRGTQGPGPGEG